MSAGPARRNDAVLGDDRRVLTPRHRDLQHVVDAQREPGLGPLELVFQFPRVRQGVNVLQTLGVPVRHRTAVGLPLQVLWGGEAEAPGRQGDVIRRLPVDGGQNPLFRGHSCLFACPLSLWEKVRVRR